MSVPRPFTDLLVPLDGSAAAERAIRPALELARRTGAPVRLMQRAFSDEVEAAAAYLARTARGCGGVDVETLVVDRDSIPDAILDARGRGTLVCMSSHGRGGFARAVMGSIAEAVLRTIDQPVLVVGPQVPEDARFAGRVVACVDGSPESEGTLAPARSWAAALGRPLWLVSVADPGAPVEWTSGRAAIETAHLGRLARRVEGVDGWDVYHHRHPAQELADRSASNADPIALLVMATHGRTGWDRLHLGSVTANTVHAARAPVLVVPAAPTNAGVAADSRRAHAGQP